MSLLDDPALGVPVAMRRVAVAVRPRVRFCTGSVYAVQLGLPSEAEGEVLDRYRVGGFDKLTVQGDGWFATEIPAGEVVKV